MNSVTICSQSCREAKANDSLEQTRTGTIMCAEATTLRRIRCTFTRQKWNQIFTGNRSVSRSSVLREWLSLKERFHLLRITCFPMFQVLTYRSTHLVIQFMWTELESSLEKQRFLLSCFGTWKKSTLAIRLCPETASLDSSFREHCLYVWHVIWNSKITMFDCLALLYLELQPRFTSTTHTL
jgi:hypothetical protein